MSERGVAKTAHFTMTGAAFTKLVRARMLDDAPGSAFRLASCLLSDDPLEQHTVPSYAIRLCNGTAKMRGDESDMQLVDDDTVSAKRYRERIKWLHAGRIRVGTKWYQPTAFVTDVGPHDVGCSPREKYYCGSDEVVLELCDYPDPKFPSIKRGVIFAQVGERPHWHEVPRGPQEALAEYLAAGRGLQERGHSAWRLDSTPPPVVRKPEQGIVPGRGPNRYKGTYDKDVRMDVDDPRYEAAKQRHVEAEDEEEERRWQEKEASRLRRVADLRALILAQAGDDLVEFSWTAHKRTDPTTGDDIEVPGGTAMIPRAPFVIWAFAKLTYLRMKIPEWKTISPSGMKMQMDDENHSDWIIGGGFDPHDREFYWGGVYAKAAEDLRTKLQNEHDDRVRAEEEAVTTLVAGPTVSGPVHFGKLNRASPAGSIVVLPNLRPGFLLAVKDAAAVITEEGGEVAHLAQIGRERGLPMVRRPGALEYFTEHSTVEVDSVARTARVTRWHVADPGDVEDDDDDT